MATYIGFYSPDAAFAAANAENSRNAGPPNTGFFDKVQALATALPEGTQIVGSYASMSSERPSVMIVEASDPAGLAAINTYYTGYLQFDWVPANVIGGSQAERDEWRKQAGQ